MTRNADTLERRRRPRARLRHRRGSRAPRRARRQPSPDGAAGTASRLPGDGGRGRARLQQHALRHPGPRPAPAGRRAGPRRAPLAPHDRAGGARGRLGRPALPGLQPHAPARPFQPVDLNQLVEEIATSARSRWTQQLAARGITGEVRCRDGPGAARHRATWPSSGRC